ncbi:hypothetical protein ACTG16_22735 [Aeromonas sp. 23P]|uniref:hypothetical protein n=1 Tax=Aeromonas sp. 23P TaxID=3452716 RepID=UPI003F79CC6B|nr:hypothetical protein [Aeromonas veronii]
MRKFTSIPTVKGLYWYFENGADEPRPVSVDVARYGEGCFGSFNGAHQRWLRDGEYLLGPQPLPSKNDDEGEASAN